MEEMLLKVVLLCSISLSKYVVEAALLTTNIDTEEPSIIISPATNDPSDGFGWAAIFHELQPVVDDDSMEMSLAKTRVIIGAPKGTYPGGLPLDDPGLPAAERSGLVYTCPLGPEECGGIVGNTDLYIGSSIQENITNHLIIRPRGAFYDSAVSEGRLFDQAPSTTFYNNDNDRLNPILLDRKPGQLMGSFLASNGNNVIACASRWAFSNFEAYPNSQPKGICFMGNRDLQNFRTVYPCTEPGQPDSSVNNNGFCSAGFSGVLLNSSLSLSALGDQSFSGTVYSTGVSSDQFSFSQVDGGRSQSIYFGFQIAAGHIRSNQQDTDAQDLAISATRFNNSGYLGNIYIYSVTPPLMRREQSPAIQGRQASEFFGHSLALVDLTGDGYDELVVGAPMYTTVTPLMPERGRIYVFFNQAGTFDVANPVMFEGRGARGRFGFSLANAGDLNGDGHEDFVVGAPYETNQNTDQNTGAVYVYYGADTREAFASQEPQRIAASDIVESVNSLNMLTSFGFSLSGSSDVDNNNHDDILVGAPFSQAVVVLRSLPFANVTLTLTSSVTEVNVDQDPRFTITVAAMYTSFATLDDFSVNFTVREMVRDDVSDPRLSFSLNDENADVFNGRFDFSSSSSSPVDVPVLASTEISQLDDFQLRVDLLDITRDLPTVTGQQTVTSLNGHPRLRLIGDNTISVRVVDPCGTDGCMSDVVLSAPTDPINLIAGSGNSEELNLNFMNRGLEDARSVLLVISQIPTEIFSAVSIAVDGRVSTSCTPSQFDSSNSDAMANCSVINRLTSGQMGSASLIFTRQDFIGNENDFSINLEIIVGDLGDVNTTNNRATVQFLVDSQSGISLELEFDSTSVEYSMESVTDIQNIGNLGSLVSLTAIVGNTGPSVIQEARLNIDFPARIMDVTGRFYFLYPSTLGTISDVSNTEVNCTQTGLNPDSLPANTSPSKRKRRSLPTTSSSRRASREAKMRAAAEGLRRKRQAMADFSLNCSTSGMCVQFTCEIRRLTNRGVRIVLDSYIDGRFFGSAASNRTFGLTAAGEVSTLTDFQMDDDQNTEDNRANVSITLGPERLVEEDDGLFIHAIIWPVIGGVIIFIGVVILLYFVGFFRRKKKPGDDEIEGDFDAPPSAEKSLKVPPEEATTV